MPFAELKTNVSVSADSEEKLKKGLAGCVALIPGKTERWLMIDIEPERRMRFGGSDLPCAMLDLQVFGKLGRDDCGRVTAAATELISSVLGIPADRIYVKYGECSLWGWNGSNF